ncbi:hypothetical protein WA577_000895 [Blastocystis sp. JDR]
MTDIEFTIPGLFEETAYETCGRAYFLKVTWEQNAEAAAEEVNEEEENKKSNEEYEKHAKKISIADMKKDDYYKVLGLDGLKWMATEEQIRSAYRKLVLKYHPDKLTNPTPEDRQIFLRVQDAYDVLGNPEKRKAYDSADVELTVPSIVFGQDFFDCFAGAFVDWSRFSQIKPVPLLGTIDTPWEEVEAFYRFWRDFKSWRVYSAYDEYNPDARPLDFNHGRWMNQMNEAHRRKLRAQDMKKVQTLVERAYKTDPRVAAYKREQERLQEEKERMEEAKRQEEAKRREEERLEKERREKEKKEEEERQRRAEAEERQRVRREKKKIVHRFMEAVGEVVSAELFKQLGEKEELAALQALAKKAEVEGYECVKAVLLKMKEEQEEQEREIEKKRMEEEAKKKEEDQKALERSKLSKTGAEWKLEEDHCLSQAVKKYPAGYRNRWVKIAEFVTEYSHCGTERTDVQCRARIEEMLKKNMGQNTKVDDGDAFARFQRGKTEFKEKNKVEITLDKRYEVSDVSAVKPTGKATAKTTGKATAAESTPSQEEKPDENGWTQSQQKALESAMKQFPATMDKAERWKKIAEAVPGKTKVEKC